MFIIGVADSEKFFDGHIFFLVELLFQILKAGRFLATVFTKGDGNGGGVLFFDIVSSEICEL